MHTPKHLLLDNFLSHANTAIPLNRMNIFLGPNGSGKSSIRNAIEYAINGKCRAMKGRTGEKSLIRLGTATGSVRYDYEIGGHTYNIHRKRTQSSSSLRVSLDEGVPSINIDEGQTLIYESLGLTSTVAEHLFDTFDIAKMDAKKRYEIIGKIMAGDATEIITYLSKQGHDLPTVVNDRIIDGFKSKGIEGAHKVANDHRLEHKRSLREITAPQLPDVSDEAKSPPDGIKAQLRALQEERDNLISKQGGNREARRQKENSIEDLKRRITEHEGNIKKGLKGLLNKGQAEIEKLQQEVTAANIAPLLNTGIANAFEIVGQLDGVSEQSIEAIKAAVDDEVEAATEAHAHQKEAEAATQKLRKQREACQDLQARIAKDDASRLAVKRMNFQLKDAIERLVALPHEDGEDVVEDIRRVDQALAEINTLQNDRNRWVEYRRALGEFKTEHQDIEERISNWDGVVEALNPNNPRLADLFASKFEPFQARFVASAETMGVPAQITPTMDISLIKKDGTIDVDAASDSEKYRIALALQISLTEALGMNMIIADYAETLVGSVHSSAMKLLEALPEGWTAMLMLSTETLPSALSGNEMVTTHWVDQGTVVPLTYSADSDNTVLLFDSAAGVISFDPLNGLWVCEGDDVEREGTHIDFMRWLQSH